MDNSKILISKQNRKFYVRDSSSDYHTQFGFVNKEDLTKEPGSELKTNKDHSLYLLDAQFIDKYHKMKRGAQIIPAKDVGFIITETGINKNSVVVDAGAGSGGLSLFLANIVKKVHSFDVRDDHIEIVKKNIELLGLSNVTLKKGSIYEVKLPKNVDVVTLDVPEPWLALPNIIPYLKPGGFIVSYSPCIPQVSDLTAAVDELDNIVYIKTVEVMEREWEAFGRKIRPKTQQRIGHSGFLTFLRKVGK